MRISVIVPCINEEEAIGDTLRDLQSLRRQGHEIIVVDGGSDDATITIARPLADTVITSPRGRAAQMNHGAAIATGDVLLFLHADTQLPPDAAVLIASALATNGRQWGCFDVRLSGKGTAFRIIEWFMNRRSRLTGIATGDQALFVTRDLFGSVGGFPDIALMEDIAISRLLKRHGRPGRPTQPVVASSRRWERHGIVRTVLLMWRLRLAFFFGANPQHLARRYRATPAR